MKKYFSKIILTFSFLLLITYLYAWARLSKDLISSLLLAIPFILVWLIPIRFWSTDRSTIRPFDHILQVLGYICMGLVNFLIISLILTDLILLIFHINYIENNHGIFVFSLTSLAFFIGLFRGHFGPAVKEIKIHYPDLPEELIGFKIVQITDLHIGPTLKRNYVEKVVSKTLGLRPDLIVLTGDIVDGKIIDIGNDAAPLKKLTNEGKAYFVMGNHDYYSGALPWIDYFKEMGMKVLLNAHDLIIFRDTPLMIAGVTDPAAIMAGHPNPNAKEAMRKHYQGKTGDALFKILLAHNPKLAQQGAEAGYDLMLSGHTHAGQFFPWTLIVRNVHKPHYWGLSQEKDMQVYVSAGTGTWGPPIRLGTKTELTLLEISR
jgi:predicted MPP superfamily phosphohydrolase